MVKTSAIFSARIDQLRPMLQWIDTHLLSMEFDSATLRKIELASEEALVNIIRHAYQERPEKIEIEIRAFPKSHAEIILKDNGPPFDPLQYKQPDTTSSLESREVGGLGIHLMRQYMDELRYHHDANNNVLVLVKRCPANYTQTT